MRRLQMILAYADAGRRANGAGWGYLCAGVGTALFSMKAIFIKLAYLPGGGLEANELEVVTLLALRMGIALPLYLCIGLWTVSQYRKSGRQLPSHKDILTTAALGLLGYYICSFLDFSGLKYVTAQLERLLLFTYPAFVFFLGRAFFKAPATGWKSMAAIALSYVGLAMIFAGGDIAIGTNVPLGSVLVLMAAFLFAFFQLFARDLIGRMGTSLFTVVAMSSASIGVLVHFAIAEGGDVGPALAVPSRIYMLGGLIAIFSTLIPSFLMNIALGRVGAQATSVLGMLGPVVTIIMAVVILGEPFGLVDAFGTGLTVLGIALFTKIGMGGNEKS